MSRPVSICFSCGEKHYKRNVNFCTMCDAPLDKERYEEWLKEGNKPMPDGWKKPETDQINTEEKKMENRKKRTIWEIAILVIVIMIIVAIGILIGNMIQNNNSVLSQRMTDLETTVQEEAQVPVSAKIVATNHTNTSDTMALNQNTSLTPLDMPLWNEYYKSGVQVTDIKSNTVWYVQSGKDGTNRLWGSITKDQILVLDCFTLVKDGTTYDGGRILMLRGPINFNNYEIYYTDGAVQLIDPDHAQELLDYNIAVKFARGNWDNNKGQFSYKPWALTTAWTLDYTYHSLAGKLNVNNDNYPR